MYVRVEPDSLRQIYEESLGRTICDRQWRRVRHDLLAYQDTPQKRIDIQDAARLRKLNPRSQITLQVVRRYQKYADCFLNLFCSGDELLEGFKRVFSKMPSINTIRRWGHEIENPFGYSQLYEPEDVRVWIAKISSQTNFPLATSPPKIKF